MIYKIIRPGKPKDLPDSMLATKDGKVVEATFDMTWSLNANIGFILSTLKTRGVTAEVVSPFCSFYPSSNKPRI